MKRRFQSWDDEVVINCVYSKIAGPGTHGPISYADFVSQNHDGFVEGFDLPNYHRRKREGELLPMTPYTKYERDTAYRGSYTITASSGSVWTWSPHWHVSGAQVTEEEVDNELSGLDAQYYVQAAAAKLYSSGWDGLTFAAELNRTISMFRGIVKRAAYVIARGKADNAWLEGRYGWRVLMYDIQDFIKLVNAVDDGRKRYSERAGYTIRNTSVTNNVEDPATASIDSWNRKVTTQWVIGTRGSIVADIEPPKIQVNPITTAWELLTLSFVVDWLVNIGQWLASLSFLTFSHEYTAAQGFKVECYRSLELVDVVDAANYSNTVTCYGDCIARKFVRVPTTVPTIPLTRLRLDAFKVLDLVALLRQALK